MNKLLAFATTPDEKTLKLDRLWAEIRGKGGSAPSFLTTVAAAVVEHRENDLSLELWDSLIENALIEEEDRGDLKRPELVGLILRESRRILAKETFIGSERERLIYLLLSSLLPRRLFPENEAQPVGTVSIPGSIVRNSEGPAGQTVRLELVLFQISTGGNACFPHPDTEDRFEFVETFSDSMDVAWKAALKDSRWEKIDSCVGFWKVLPLKGHQDVEARKIEGGSLSATAFRAWWYLLRGWEKWNWRKPFQPFLDRRILVIGRVINTPEEVLFGKVDNDGVTMKVAHLVGLLESKNRWPNDLPRIDTIAVFGDDNMGAADKVVNDSKTSIEVVDLEAPESAAFKRVLSKPFGRERIN